MEDARSALIEVITVYIGSKWVIHINMHLNKDPQDLCATGCPPLPLGPWEVGGSAGPVAGGLLQRRYCSVADPNPCDKDQGGKRVKGQTLRPRTRGMCDVTLSPHSPAQTWPTSGRSISHIMLFVY